MTRARLCDIELAQSDVALCRRYLDDLAAPGCMSHHPSAWPRAMQLLFNARRGLGTGPRKGPRIEAAYAQVWKEYIWAADRLFTALKNELLDLPPAPGVQGIIEQMPKMLDLLGEGRS